MTLKVGLFLSALLVITACTSKAETIVQVPTLAVLSSATPSPTFTASPMATTTQTNTPTPTLTMTPTDTATSPPTIAPTDCGASAWWNFSGGTVIDYMKDLSVLVTRMDQFDKATPTLNQYLGFGSYRDELSSNLDAFKNRDYPLCAKTARDALLDALYKYHQYVFERHQKDADVSIQYYDPKRVTDALTAARGSMATAASEIHQLTGADTKFLLEDGIS